VRSYYRLCVPMGSPSVAGEAPAGVRASDGGEVLLAPAALLGIADVTENQDPDPDCGDDHGNEEEGLDR